MNLHTIKPYEVDDNAYTLGTREPRLELIVCEPTPTFMLHPDAADCIWLKARLGASALADL